MAKKQKSKKADLEKSTLAFMSPRLQGRFLKSSFLAEFRKIADGQDEEAEFFKLLKSGEIKETGEVGAAKIQSYQLANPIFK